MFWSRSIVISCANFHRHEKHIADQSKENIYEETKAAGISGLTASTCFRHPADSNKGKHALYEGAEKPKYECKHCGASASSLSNLTASTCPRHPLGANKGHHEPAL